MKYVLCFLLLITLINNCYSQHRDNLWCLGYSSYTADTLAGGILMDYTNAQVAIYNYPRKLDFFETNASICDLNGNLLFSTNGLWIANTNQDTMLNGNGLNPSFFTTQWNFWGMRIPQGDIIIPKPGDSSKYYLFHETIDVPVIYYPNKLYVTTIDMQGDSGRGEVIDKNKIILNDTLIAGALTACKHANGRDWWLIVPEYGTELGFYTFLITPDTIEQINYQKSNAGGMGRMQSCFSPDGSKYIISNWYGIAFYDFDRCTGSISFNDSIAPDIDSLNWFGASVSPNSRYAYSCGDDGYNFYQFDLQATDISLSKTLVAQWDTFAYPWAPWWTAFYMHQIAPDGKIYIECPGTTMAMHTIEFPDSGGVACNLQQHSILLPHFNATIPNFPNYNLGPLLGSICDSLGMGVNENAVHHFGLRVNPNPCSNYFYLNYDIATNKNLLFVLYDSFGKEVLRRNLYGTTKYLLVSTNGLSDGVYYGAVSDGVRRETIKIVIIKN